MGRDHLTAILTILTMDFLNKFKKILKNRKKFIDMFFYLWIDGISNFMQFHYRLIVHQRPLNWNRCRLYKILIVFDGLSNNIEIP
jgi:hypothetical protein